MGGAGGGVLGGVTTFGLVLTGGFTGVGVRISGVRLTAREGIERSIGLTIYLGRYSAHSTSSSVVGNEH